MLTATAIAIIRDDTIIILLLHYCRPGMHIILSVFLRIRSFRQVAYFDLNTGAYYRYNVYTYILYHYTGHNGYRLIQNLVSTRISRYI